MAQMDWKPSSVWPSKLSKSFRYVIKIREFAKFVVGLGEKVSATDIEESMRVGVDTSHGGKRLGPHHQEQCLPYGSFLYQVLTVEVLQLRYRIQIPLPPKIDPSVTMMTVEDRVPSSVRQEPSVQTYPSGTAALNVFILDSSTQNSAELASTTFLRASEGAIQF